MTAPKEIYLNISDEFEPQSLDNIDWAEVTWTRDEPALNQYLLYVSWETLSKFDDRVQELEAEVERLRKDKIQLTDEILRLERIIYHQ